MPKINIKKFSTKHLNEIKTDIVKHPTKWDSGYKKEIIHELKTRKTNKKPTRRRSSSSNPFGIPRGLF